MDALVTDVHLASAVSGLRGLGRAGHRVVALSPGRTGAGLWSRYASARAVGPQATDYGSELAARVGELARENGSLVVYPGHERAIDALLGSSSLPRQAVLPYPDDAQRLCALRDKRRLPGLAARSGFRAPRTFREATAGELTSASCPVPCVVKRARPGAKPASACVVRSTDELHAMARTFDPTTPLLVQEWIRGKLIVAALVLGRQGNVVASFQQVVKRTWPSAAGTAALAVSVAPDQDLISRAGRMLAGAGYWGLAQLDLLQTSDATVLIDVNPRFYTSLPLALASGVNLPAIWHAVATGEDAGAPGSYRVGVSFRWLEGALSGAMRGSPKALLGRAPRPRAGAMWASDDPLPAALLAADAFLARVGRRVPRRLRRSRRG